jgi:hypothetical protein
MNSYFYSRIFFADITSIFHLLNDDFSLAKEPVAINFKYNNCLLSARVIFFRELISKKDVKGVALKFP